jgi:outer membrane protein assembly factor BamB
LPISAALLWSLDLRAGDAAGDGAPSVTPHPLEVIPLEEGWLCLDAAGQESRIHWVDDGGRLLSTLAVEGAAWGPVRAGGRCYSALRRANQDLVACFLPQKSDGSASLRLLWKAPAGRLMSGQPLAAWGGTIILCEESAIRAISSEDGSARWTSRDVEGSLAPAISGGRVLAAGRKGPRNGVLAALDAADGSLLWKVERPGSMWDVPSVLAGRVVAAVHPAKGQARIVELEVRDGVVRREIDALPADPRAPLILTGERIFAAGKAMTSVLSSTGDLVGRVEGHEAAAGIAGYGLLLVASDRGVRCVDTSTLDTVWTLSLPGPADSLVCERGMVVGTAGDQIFCLGAR